MEELKIVSLCRVTLSSDQITIFDTGQGMDASNKNFIENWSLDFPLIAHNPVSHLNDGGCPISNQVIFYVYFIWLWPQNPPPGSFGSLDIWTSCICRIVGMSLQNQRYSELLWAIKWRQPLRIRL